MNARLLHFPKVVFVLVFLEIHLEESWAMVDPVLA
jgi:hypothetical protein